MNAAITVIIMGDSCDWALRDRFHDVLEIMQQAPASLGVVVGEIEGPSERLSAAEVRHAVKC